METSINENAREAHVSKYFSKAEEQFESLLQLDELDREAELRPPIVQDFERVLNFALDCAYAETVSADRIHLFLQRVLYRINRLKLFWYDDLDSYKNERSEYLRSIRNRIESAWEPWELSQFEMPCSDAYVVTALRARAEADVSPPISTDGKYFRDEVGVNGYRKLLEIASLDGLVEASQLSRTLGGVGNEIHSMMTRLLVEEYGGGRLSRKHSSYFTVMLEELGMKSQPEAYFDVVPWQVLAAINHSFLLSERKRSYLRYVGELLYTEISVPAAFDNYRLAAERLGMSSEARGYWELHIREDERHGRWMLNDVALPLAAKYPNHASEIVLGYDQQKFMSERAGKAVTLAAKAADSEQLVLPAPAPAAIGVAA